MRVKLCVLVDAVAITMGWHYNDASECVRRHAKALGYPRPGETGLWHADIPAILRLVTRGL